MGKSSTGYSAQVAPRRNLAIAPRPSSTVASEHNSAFAPKRNLTIAPRPSSTVAPEQSSPVAPEQSSAVAPRRNLTIAPRPSSTVAPEQNPAFAPKRYLTIAPRPSSAVAPEHSSAAPEQSSAVAPKRNLTIAPRPNLTVAPEQNSAFAPRRDLNTAPRQNPTVTPEHPVPQNGNSRKRPMPSSSANPPIRPRAKRQRVVEDTRALEAVRLAVALLEEEFKRREKASQEFPPEISSSHIRTAVSRYEDEMLAATERSICSCCGRFVSSADIYQVSDQDDRLHQMDLDQCGFHENSWDFCRLCYTAISQRRVPKFSASNFVNVTMCQDYPSALEDLTAVEECLIARCHPVGTVLKLRPGGRASPTNHNALRGHMIVIPQDPGPLLHILPSPELRLENLIKVFWLGKHPPANRDLKPFLQVRKDKVLTALNYLVQHNPLNPLYHDLAINYAMVDSWPEDFIPPEIADNITCLTTPDHHEREGYTVNLQHGNYENDLHAAQDGAFHADDNDSFMTGSVYTDINGERTDPNVRMIDALLGLVTNNSSKPDEETQGAENASDDHRHRQRDTPMISYAIRGQATLMSSWEDPNYFTGAFPTLFPRGLGGHQDKRPVAVSLEAFAQWALNHHSRRYLPCKNITTPS